MIRRFVSPWLLLAAAPLAAEEPAVLAPVVVTAGRSAQAADSVPLAVSVFSSDDLRASPSLAVDDTLRSDPAFGLFRRTGSLTANPTAQGVSLRGLGPSGAGRSLVLLDGVPLNDSFGGWVAWTKLPKLSLASAEIVHGGGSGAWGNAALGGTVQLITAAPASDSGSAEVFAGDFGTRGAEALVTGISADGKSGIGVDAAAFATDGVGLVRDPGPIDRPADLAYRRAQATFRHAFTDTLLVSVTARLYDEDRGNGTPLQRNASEERFVSVTVTGSDTPAFNWSAVAYAQDQSFDSFFSSVNAARTAETPANDQYDVPAVAAGAAFTAAWGGPGDSAITTLGADFRRVEGETRELFNFSAGLFDRRAGGEQTFAGAFVRHDREIVPSLRLSGGARTDFWSNTGGFLRESGPVPVAQTFAGRDGVELSPDLGLVWRPSPAVRARAAAYRAFRVPTLNEYYRPFRVGAVVTNANPGLDPETLAGCETGLDLGREDAPLGASVTAFANELSDAVANVTIAPNTRQRRNLDRVRVQGIEASLRARPLAALRFEAGWLFTDARVTDPGAAAPAALDGKRLAQVPRHTLSVSTVWDAPAAFRVSARARRVSAQYEDDENTLSLAPATTVDLTVSRRFARRWEVFVAVENLFDAEVETGRTAAGIVSIAPPRWTRAGLRCDW